MFLLESIYNSVVQNDDNFHGKSLILTDNFVNFCLSEGALPGGYFRGWQSPASHYVGIHRYITPRKQVIHRNISYAYVGIPMHICIIYSNNYKH